MAQPERSASWQHVLPETVAGVCHRPEAMGGLAVSV